MTYTNGYQPQNTGASAYSPFNRSAGAAPPSYEGYPAAVPMAPGNPYASPLPMGADTFSPVSSYQDMDAISNNINQKIAQIRQAFAAPGAAPGMPAPGGAPRPAAPPVPEADIQWALQLEQRVQQGHQPNAQEVARYEDIAARLQAQQTGAAPAPAGAPQTAAAPAAPAVPEADIQWALQLEQRVQQGHEPTAQETARYEDIAARLQAQQSGAAPAPAGAPQTAAAPAVPEADIQWALQLEQRVQQGHEPNAQEVARYEDIAARLQAQQSGAAPAPAGAPQTGARNWADWSKPFSVPAAPQMPLPIAGPGGQAVVNVPTSLRGAPQTPPAAQLNQAPGPNWGTPPAAPQQPQMSPQMQPGAPAAQMPSQQEIDWALGLEQRVNTQNYRPTPQETAQYENIAQRIMAAQQRGAAPPQAPQQPQMAPPPQMPQQPMAPQQPQMAPQQQGLPNGLTQQEIDWALGLEQRVNTQNYTPTPQEMAQYENIAQRLNAGIQQAPQAPQQPVMPQSGPQYMVPQSPPQIPIVPQQYPQVQPQTPQWVMSPQDQRQTYYPQQPMPQPGMPQQPGFPQQPGMPQPMQPPGQQSSGPGFMDRLKNAWGALWN